MNTFNARLEKVLTDKKLNANSFAAALGYDKPEKIYRLLRDDKNKPSLDILQDISNVFEDINIEWLISGRGEPYKTAATPQPTAEIPAVPKAKNVVVPAIQAYRPAPADDTAEGVQPKPRYGSYPPRIVTVNEHGIDNILYVPIKAQAGYLIGYGDPDFIESLPSFRMPGLSNQTYRMFEVQGVSMNPTLSDRDRVIAEWVPSLDDIRENRIHVVVHTGGVAVKRVLNRAKERNAIYLKSDTLTHRQDYPLLEINPADILEIWYVRMRISSDLREPSELYNRVSDLEIYQHEIMKKLGIGK
jgi:phage repressor protein C with HTH and peptisase S24 domain